jgi:phosphate transport system substrate-binding protein
MKVRSWVLTGVLAIFLGSVPAQAQVKVDPKLPEYKPVQGISGALKSIGSDSMLTEMTKWTEEFTKFYPTVRPEIEGKGSATAPPALIQGTAHFGPMSREMKPTEIDAFKKQFGYDPVPLTTSIDALAVFVNKDNPIKGLTLQQVDAIFSSTRKGGHPAAINTWGDLGLEGEWKNKPIVLYGRNNASGTYTYFREHALFNGDYRKDVKEQPGSGGVVQAVGTDKFAIGYSGIGYATADVRAVPLARDQKAEKKKGFVPADPARVYSGEYPLARKLMIYINYRPGSELDPLRREFIRYLYSQQGQNTVVSCGYLPVGEKLAAKELASVGLK